MATEITGAPDDEAVRHSIADGVFDAVVCAMALHWLPDTIGAVARALRPGGVLGSCPPPAAASRRGRSCSSGPAPPRTGPAGWSRTSSTPDGFVHDWCKLYA